MSDVLTPEELAEYTVPSSPEAPTALPPVDVSAQGAPAQAQAQAQDELSPDEIAAYSATPGESAPRRVNMIGAHGQLVDVAPEDVDLVQRKYGYRLDPNEIGISDQTVHLLEDGRVNSYVANDPEFRAKLAAGATVATPQEVQAEYSDFGSQAATFAEGAAQGASLGLYGLAADGLAGDDYTRERQLREEENPGTALAGNIAGAVAPAMLSGGTGAAGTLARMTPAGRLAALGTRLGETLTAGAGTALGRIGGTALAAGLEGAADNAARQVTADLTAGDTDGFAERALDAAWDGAVWGGLLGGGLAAIGEGVSAAGRARRAATETEAIDEIAPAVKAAEEATPARPLQAIDSELEAAQQRLAEADAIGEPSGVEAAENLVEQLNAEREAALSNAYMTSEGQIDLSLRVEETEEAKGLWERMRAQFAKVKDARELEERLDDVISEKTRSITDRLDDVQRARQNKVNQYLTRNNKPKAIRQALEAEGHQLTTDHVDRILRENAEAEEAIDTLIREYPLGDDVARRKLAPLRAAKDAITGQRKYLTEVKGAGPVSPTSRILRNDLDSVGQVFWAEDTLKSYLGQIAKKKGEVVTPAEAAVQRLYMRKRSSLQDKRLWGNALTEMQTVTNAIESRAIPAGRAFQNRFGLSKTLLEEHAGEHGFEELLEIDPGKVESLLKTLGDSSSYKDEASFVRGLLRNVELAEAKARYYPMPDEALAEVAKARAMVGQIIEEVKEVKALKLRRDIAKRLAKNHEGIDKVMLAMDLAGSFVPGIHLAGKGAATMYRGAKLAASVVGLGQSAVKQEELITKHARTAVKNLMDGAAKPPARLPGAGISANALRRAIEDARALQDPESEASANLASLVEDISEDSPELAASVEAKVRAKADFIVAKAGPALDESDPFNPRPRMTDPVTARKTARYVDAARSPAKALERLAHGIGSPEDKETLQALYPSRYQRFADQVVSAVRARKTAPTRHQRQMLHWITGVAMSRDQAPSAIGAYQALFAGQPDQRATRAAQERGSLEPMVTRGKAAPVEGMADQTMARSDAIMTARDD